MAEVLRVGVATEEALEKASARATARGELRGARGSRLPVVVAVLALAVAGLGAYIFLHQEAVVAPEARPGEPLKLKLEFAFPAARR